MGFQRDPGPRKRRCVRTLALDESGQLSIDFMIGLSIFLITLIIAATMISGLLVGLQSKTIDYDAVAYRTGVILIEDPGEPNTVFNYDTITEEDQWEFIGADQKDLVDRFGFTLYKSTPRVLREEKINSFFHNKAGFSPSEYRERIVFGSYPYRLNVSLRVIGDDKLTEEYGEPFDPDSSYGYIRRVVLVKNQSSAVVDMGRSGYYTDTATGNEKFKVELDYQNLMNIDGAPNYIAPQYWVEPPKENITINLKNVDRIKNRNLTINPSGNVILKTIRIQYNGHHIDGTDRSGELPVDLDNVSIDGQLPVTFFWNTQVFMSVTSSVNITLPAGFFIPLSSMADVKINKIDISYEFDPNTVNLSQINNIYYYDERNRARGFSSPSLKPAILEVRIW
jgi:hypothetical protein